MKKSDFSSEIRDNRSLKFINKRLRMFFMFIVAVLASTTAYAQVEKYGFSLAGIEVTSANYENLSGLAGIEGTVTYDPTVNKLTLNNATITTTGITNAILNSTCENLEIEVTGTNSLTSKEAAITNTAATTISGTGTLNAKSTSSAAIYLERAPFAIKECKLYAEGNWGICGDDVSEELYITHAYVDATGAAGSICDLGYLDLTECSITQPADAEFDVTQYGVAVDGTIVTDKVIIKPEAEFKEYGFSIAGIKVTSTNYENLSDFAGVEGTITYDPTANKLTLDNASVTASSAFSAIENTGCENLEIEVIGNNNIKGGEIAFDNISATTISGTGSLNIKSERSAAVYLEGAPLTIKNCKVYAAGTWGIAGDQETEGLNISDAYLEATGTQGSICAIAALNLENCSVTQPTGAVFDAAVHGVAVDGTLVTEKVVISKEATFEKYGFSLAGIEVTSSNCKNLSDLAGVEGTITYDPTAKKLTLDNATITASSAFAAIDNQECENLEIELIGTNNISAREIAFDNAVPTTISGTGTLKAKSERSAAFYIESTTLTVKDSKLYAEGLWGISGDQESETINVAGAYIEAIGKQGSICTIAALNLENCSIIQPTGAAFDAAVHGVAVDGALVTEKVVISTETNAIQGINTDMQTGKQGICTMQGMKMGKQWNELPAGIYIVDGVKCIKK